MKRTLSLVLATLAAGAALSGCAAYPKWLPDMGFSEFGMRQTITLSDEEAARLRSDIAPLKAQATDIRARLALETDPRVRSGYYSDLHDLYKRITPVEKTLIAAGRPIA